MANYTLDPIGVVENLRSLLRDQYDPRSIFKELVQNADDAGSSVLHLARHSGWLDHINPLLRVPALLVLNNGPFLVENAIAFNKIGVGSKSGDDLAIGKFGRGLKSIFHLSEAFFFFGSEDQEGLKSPEYHNQPNVGLLNPWEGTGYHPDWTCGPDVLALLKETVLGAWPQGSPTWFCLWIPLKCATLLDGVAPIVQPSSCALAEILTEDFSRRAAELLPLLRNLDTITYWQDLSMPHLSVRLNTGALRRRYPAGATGTSDDVLSSGTIQGTIVCVEAGGRSLEYFYSGQETLSQDPVFAEMRDREDWPRVSVWIHSTGESQQEKDKTRPHAAVVFQQLPSSGKNSEALQVSRTVFLPLTDSEKRQPIPGSARSYRLHLHGCYFVDAGRRDVVLTAGNVTTEYVDRHKALAREWNTALEKRTLLPLLLPALRDFAAAVPLSFTEIQGLTEAVRGSELLAGKQASLCVRHHWIAQLTPDGPEWRLSSAKEPYYTLPPPPNAQYALPFAVLPGLALLCRAQVISFSELPRVTEQPPASWRPLLSELLNSVPAKDVFGQEKRLDYLTAFLGTVQDVVIDEVESSGVHQCSVDSVQSCFREKIRDAFCECGVKRLRRHAESVRRLFALLPADSVVLTPNSLPPAMQDALATLPVTPLLLPPDLWPGQEATGSFSPEEAAKVLAWLETAKISQKLRSDTALTILANTSEELQEKLAHCGDYELFHVRARATDADRSASWRQIRGWQESGSFVARDLKSVKVLTAALDPVDLYHSTEHVISKIPETLLPDIPLPELYCNPDFCVRMLNRCPALASPAKRGGLLKELLDLLKQADTLEVRQAIRYLLHGDNEAFAKEGLNLYRRSRLAEIWTEVVQRTLSAKGQGWRLIPAILSDNLTDFHGRALGIVPIDALTSENLLREAGAACLLGWQPDTATREAILLAIQDSALWQELPLHLTTTGDLIAIQGVPCYLRGHVSPPVPLAPVLHIIDCATGTPLRQLYAQREIKEWDSWGVLRTALQMPDSSKYYLEILDALETIKDAIANSHDMLRELKREPWLPAGTGSVAPHSVISLNGVVGSLHHLLARPELQGCLHPVDSIAESARKHPGFAYVRKYLLPSPAETFALLAKGISFLPDYTVGEPVLENSDLETVRDLLNAVKGVDLARFPGLQLLREVAGQDDLQPYLTVLYIALRKPSTLADYRSFFTPLKRGYTEQTGPRVYNAYFRALVRRPEFRRTDLDGLFLRDARANWKTADKLCEDFPGIDPADRLRDDLLKILCEEERQHPAADMYVLEDEASRPTVKQDQAADVLERYFRDWIASGVREEVIGLFLAFISDQEDIVALARKYLGDRHPVDDLRRRLGWKVLDRTRQEMSEQDRYLWRARAQREFMGYGLYYSRSKETLQNAFGRRAFRFLTEETQTDGLVDVTNLMGGHFRARRSSNADSLFLGELAFVPIPGQAGTVQVCLRRLDTERLDRDKLNNLLYEASRQILREVYAQSAEALIELFEEMTQSEQLDIEATQRSILKSAFFYLRQLDTRKQHKQHQIASLAKNWFDLDYEEENESRATGGRAVEVERKRAEILEQLKDWLEHDAVVQEEICTAVRGKVKQQQYTAQSVLFELFQNADDAVTEKRQMYGEWKDVPNSDLTRQVVLQWSEGGLQWIHWGRTINRCRGGNLTEEQGKEWGYYADLWKMLVLSASDKHSSNISGKLGLGFKSVLLVTGRPSLVSGDLRCEIVAGMYPKKLDGDTSERLSRILEEAKGSDVREAGTLIDLPLRQEAKIQEVTVEFLEFAHLLPIFAHSLRRIDLRPIDGAAESVFWRPRPLGTGIAIGELFPTCLAREKGHQSCRAMVLRPERGTHGLLFAVGPQGIAALPPSVPTYWVTLPARGSENGAGIAVNANFEVDPGRVQLANKQVNESIAVNLGQRLNAAFAALYMASQNWPELATALSLAADTKPMCFWRSLFNQTLAPFHADTEQQKHQEVLRHVLWTNGGGMAELLTKCYALPTELPGSYDALTCLPEVRWQAVGLLECADVFQQAATWDRFAMRCTPGQIVSASRVGVPLQRLGVLSTVQNLTLKDALEGEIPEDGRITATLAARFGMVLTPEFLESREGSDASEAERKEKAAIRERLRELLFPTGQGNYVSARDLLLQNDPKAPDEEERNRAAFCPDTNRLANEFVGEALEFFKACRGTMYAPEKRLVEWGMMIVSQDTERQKAFLDYLLKGSLTGSMQIDPIRRDRCWLGTLPVSPLRQQYSESDWMTLLGKVGFNPRDVERRRREPEAHGNLEIQKIAEWWLLHRGEQLRHYEKKLYPDGGAFLQNLLPPYRCTPEARIAWMTLLLRSSLETMGRVKIEAHNGFLHEHGNAWIRNQVEATSPGEALYTDLCRFMDVKTFDIRFLHWVRHYVPVAVFANWLDEIVDIILQLEKIEDSEIKQGLDGFLRARHNEYFHGSGLDAPPLTPLLGLGIHFLVREIYRKGVLTNPVLRPYCYVPTAKIRRLMAACGLPLSPDLGERWRQSEHVHAFIQDALKGQAQHFCQDGDVPLQIVASDRGLWGQFLPSTEYLEEEELEWDDWKEAGQDA